MAHSIQQTTASSDNGSTFGADVVTAHAARIKSEDLFQQRREVEIEHQGRIYRLRLTQLNKLILTA